jgi:hypothetical protein
MPAQNITRIVAITVVASVAVLTPAPSIGVASVSASSEPARRLHLTKWCYADTYNGNAGDWCTVQFSSLRRIPIDSRIFYSQALGVPTGLLDSNIVLDAGDGNRAVGRCTLDLATNLGLCTFSDGTGKLAGFQARLNVTCEPPDGLVCELDGTYSFTRESDKDR